jgi:PKD repeat protein
MKLNYILIFVIVISLLIMMPTSATILVTDVSNLSTENWHGDAIERTAENSTLSSLVTGIGTSANGQNFEYAYIKAGRIIGEYKTNQRTFVIFNTSDLPDDSTIVSAVIDAPGHGKSNGLGALSYTITGFYPATVGKIVIADYSKYDNILMSSTNITYGGFDTGDRYGYNCWTLNAAGIKNISKTGYSNFSIRSNADIDNYVGYLTWVYDGTSYILMDGPTYGGGTLPARLIITYTGTPPVSSFTGSPALNSTGVSPLLVNFTDTSTNIPTAWKWYAKNATGNNTPFIFNTTQNPLYYPFYAGNWSIFLNASNSAGGTNSTDNVNWYNVTDEVIVLPVAGFSANSTSGSSPLPVLFTDSSVDNILGWYWEFGGGATNISTDSNPTYTFIGAGTYDVRLQVTNASGSDWENKTGYITANAAAPISSFTSVPSTNSTGIAPLTVNFTDTSINGPTAWKWYFNNVTGNNTPALFNSTSATPSIVFGIGNFSVFLNASNSYGGTNSTANLNWYNVTNLTIVPPVAGFSANSTSGHDPGVTKLSVQFTDSSVDNILTWYWEFGSALNTSSAQNPTYVFDGVGTYNVNLRVTNASGTDWENKTGYITVTAISPPVSSFTANVTSGKYSQAVSFFDTSTNLPTAWKWYFNNVTGNNTYALFSVLQDQVWVFRVGNYSIKLNASNVAGGSNSTQTTFINVSASSPAVLFTSDVTSGTAPLTVQFTDLSAYSPTAWKWNFTNVTPGNNTPVTFSVVQNPTWVFGVGNYNIKLNATNDDGFNITSGNYFVNASASVPLPPADVAIANKVSDIQAVTAVGSIIGLIMTVIAFVAKRF